MSEDFQLGYTVDRGPHHVWGAVVSVADWLSRELQGDTATVGAEFTYHYQDVHRCRFRVEEAVPGRRLVWRVLENHFNFTKDPTEWVGTQVIFTLTEQDGATRLDFEHRGLVSAYECFEICRDAWTGYLTGSLRELILTGKGQPNPIEAVVEAARVLADGDFQVKVVLPVVPGVVMAAVERPQAWWAEDIAGSAARIDDTFVFQYKDMHRSLQKVVEQIPARRAVWEVTESQLNFLKNKTEWTGTRLVFEAIPREGGCELVFTHVGLTPSLECYADCVAGWTYFITDSLAALVNTGTGKPEASSEA
jgi:hypothetical protein